MLNLREILLWPTCSGEIEERERERVRACVRASKQEREKYPRSYFYKSDIDFMWDFSTCITCPCLHLKHGLSAKFHLHLLIRANRILAFGLPGTEECWWALFYMSVFFSGCSHLMVLIPSSWPSRKIDLNELGNS
jgi:hypothetical protein